ncbi:MAG: peptidoglycan-binding protein [Acidobacteria bacterium]|nr:peptidoglycan-binding protein [Acidobacteriota bacterium]
MSASGVPASAARIRRGPTAPKAKHSKATKVKKAKAPVGPRAIEDARATQIQAALIKAGYLSGQPSGHWDAASEAAMEKLQSDNGWQTKLVPDSRALIKLGLGPGQETATTSASTSSASITVVSAKNE